MDCWIFWICFFKFLIFFLDFFSFFRGFLLMLLMLLLKVTNVTNGHQKLPNNEPKQHKQLFFLPEGQKKPRTKAVALHRSWKKGLHSWPFLQVHFKKMN